MSHFNEGSVLAGKYRVERLLARGGMGSLWVGRHLLLDIDVAIKFMDACIAASPDARARFNREAKTCAQIKSDHVVRVLDFGFEEDVPYLVMELLEGEDLASRLKRRGRLSLPEVSQILTEVSRGLRRAHELGLVHRDLKPANIFLARGEEQERAKILDFGVAKVTGGDDIGESTQSGIVMGSPHYMSPEQTLASKSLDPRSDVWALGVIAFRAATGRLPFMGEQLAEVLVNICTAPVPSASSLLEGLPPELDAFFARALERDRTKRFQSARELASAFEEVVISTSSWRGAAKSVEPASSASRSSRSSGSSGPPVSLRLPGSLRPSERSLERPLERPSEADPATLKALQSPAEIEALLTTSGGRVTSTPSPAVVSGSRTLKSETSGRRQRWVVGALAAGAAIAAILGVTGLLRRRAPERVLATVEEVAPSRSADRPAAAPAVEMGAALNAGPPSEQPLPSASALASVASAAPGASVISTASAAPTAAPSRVVSGAPPGALARPSSGPGGAGKAQGEPRPKPMPGWAPPVTER